MIILLTRNFILGILFSSFITTAAPANDQPPQAVINIQGQQATPATPRPTARPSTELSLPTWIAMIMGSAAYFEQFPLTSVWMSPAGFTQEAVLLAAAIYCTQHLCLHWDEYAARATFLRNFLASRAYDCYTAGAITGNSLRGCARGICNMMRWMSGNNQTPQSQEHQEQEENTNHIPNNDHQEQATTLS